MAATLTERYISAVTRSLPVSARADVRTELEASLADAIDARIEQGAGREEAEREELTDLGDPGALAAGYAERPLHLIGPRYYLTWLRLLKLLLWIVPVCAGFAVALGLATSDAPIGEVAGQSAATVLSVAVHVCFWVTLVFVVLERSGSATGMTWTVDMLPESPEREGSKADLIASVVFLLLAAGAVAWDYFRGFFPTGGDPISILHPSLWPWGVVGLFVLMGAEGAVAFFVYGRGGWTRTLAVVNSSLALLFISGFLTLLGNGALVNPEFLAFVTEAGGAGLAEGNAAAAEQGGVFRILAVLAAAGIIAVSVWDAFDGWRQALRSGDA